MIGKNEITALINTAYDAVNNSKAGPIVMDKDNPEKMFNPLGYNTFLYVISKIIPADVSMAANIKSEDEEPINCETKIT